MSSVSYNCNVSHFPDISITKKQLLGANKTKFMFHRLVGYKEFFLLWLDIPDSKIMLVSILQLTL